MGSSFPHSLLSTWRGKSGFLSDLWSKQVLPAPVNYPDFCQNRSPNVVGASKPNASMSEI